MRIQVFAISARFKPLFLFLLTFAAFRFLFLLYLGHLLNAFHVFRPSLSKSLKIDVFDEHWQRCFPGLLLVVCNLTEPFRIHTKLPCHLDMGMGQVYTGGIFFEH